ncbi:hypothetical protein J14TS5_11100 [Paenibacillus lautus]|uniref:nucleoside-triphosphatase n=1 Tax=Paenibacillus lautus TaxID=1401 RepID=UPI001B291C93|nr:hypothetical protein J14TS5_11100 [Paenibacillus lautus]
MAVCLEFLEETGVVIRPSGISGVYYNERLHVLSVVFHAEYVSGEITIQPEEILEAKFLNLDDTNMDEYIKRPQVKSRTLDAMNADRSVPYETWDLNPPRCKLLSRMDVERLEAKHAFLLTGAPRIGKTTMIKQLINAIGPDLCGGFYTEEITNSSERIGFKCVSVRGESVEIAHIENPSSTRIGRYGMDVEAFEDFAVKILENALSSKKIIVIDEIGLMQMLSASFQKIVQEIITGPRIVLGTIPLESHPEIDIIKYRKEVRILSVNAFNRDTISETLLKDIVKALEGE